MLKDHKSSLRRAAPNGTSSFEVDFECSKGQKSGSPLKPYIVHIWPICLDLKMAAYLLFSLIALPGVTAEKEVGWLFR